MQLNKKGVWVGWGGGMIPIEASIALSFSLNYCDSNLVCGHERFDEERPPFSSFFLMRKPKLALKRERNNRRG